MKATITSWAFELRRKGSRGPANDRGAHLRSRSPGDQGESRLPHHLALPRGSKFPRKRPEGQPSPTRLTGTISAPGASCVSSSAGTRSRGSRWRVGSAGPPLMCWGPSLRRQHSYDVVHMHPDARQRPYEISVTECEDSAIGPHHPVPGIVSCRNDAHDVAHVHP